MTSRDPHQPGQDEEHAEVDPAEHDHPDARARSVGDVVGVAGQHPPDGPGHRGRDAGGDQDPDQEPDQGRGLEPAEPAAEDQ